MCLPLWWEHTKNGNSQRRSPGAVIEGLLSCGCWEGGAMVRGLLLGMLLLGPVVRGSGQGCYCQGQLSGMLLSGAVVRDAVVKGLVEELSLLVSLCLPLWVISGRVPMTGCHIEGQQAELPLV